jgi:hypothetical protein
MKTELLYLTLAAALTGLLWVPYILDRSRSKGLSTRWAIPRTPSPSRPGHTA